MERLDLWHALRKANDRALPILLTLLLLGGTPSAAQELADEPIEREPPSRDILSDEKWDQIRDATDKALRYLAEHQNDDGAFEAPDLGQPGITGLCTLAFLANGHQPGQGEYGEVLTKAVEFILDCQKENGLISVFGPSGEIVRGNGVFSHEVGVAASYNHAISGLALGEVYGASAGAVNEEQLRQAIEAAVKVSLTQQKWPQNRKADEGGWRYMHSYVGTDSDLPVTGWQIMMLRSAKNAGFEVPDQAMDDAAAYVLRCFNQQRQMFDYDATGAEGRNRAMAGVGILALAHASHHETRESLIAADFILDQGFPEYNKTNLYNPANRSERYHYSVCQCTLAMYQIGGDYWTRFFPATAESLLANQNTNGSWDAESNRDTQYGRAYTTALVTIALSVPNQFLPIYQR